ncbi:GerAB/ArcD/ProY family transporter [Caldalkalibacillus mannanilyticus]|uniref:GerAB/ArcD/ProY family transporter n=1 Tax=Caldalkalibacillus mannanilyticus TaxID=1418 RepID=UPI0004694E39|nr:GerAB/ArcD/ProY family transporter [Caldalkalibacillus mannanilyticus]
MNNQNHYQIIPIEMSISIMSFIIGVGILTIPRSLAQELETPDGWISIALSGVLVMIIISLYVRLQRYFPGQTLLQFIGKGSIGKWMEKLLALIFFIYFLSIAAFLARILSVVVKLYLLDQTPAEVIVATMLLLTTYAAYRGVQGLVHLNLIFMPIIFLVVLVIITANLGPFSFAPLRPVLSEGISPVLIAVKETFFAFTGFEILYFLMAYMKKSDLRAIPLNITIGIITLLYILVTIFSYSLFSLDATKFITFPTLEIAKEIEVPGGFVERLESLMMTVWIMTIFNTMAMNHFLASTILKDYFTRSKHMVFQKLKAIMPIVVQFIIFIVAFIPNSLPESFTFSDWIGWLGGVLIISGVVFGYLTVWIRKRKKVR